MTSPLELKKKFIKLLQGASHTRSTYEVFSDFLELSYCAIAKSTVIQDDERADALEDRYMAVVGRYKDRDLDIIRNTYPEMLAIMLQGAPLQNDFLGEVAGEMELLNKHGGQFFTPYSLCRMMAEVNFLGSETVLEKQGYITIHEPTVGAGAMILAAADYIEGLGYSPAKSMFVYAVDLSAIAYKMSYLQFTARGIPAKVVNGNSLSLETYEHSVTPAYYRFLLANPTFLRDWNSPTKSEEKPEIRVAEPLIQIPTANFTIQGDLFANPEAMSFAK